MSDTTRLPSAGEWNDFAAVYERLAEPHTRLFASEALRRAGPLGPGDRVLDVAAGTGALTLAAMETGAEVTAVDFSPAMVERLRARVAERDPAAAARVRVMDGMALDLPDDRFDAAFSVFGVMLFPDPARGLAEMRRVAHPGGTVAAAVWGDAEGAGPMILFHRAFRAVFPDRPTPPAFPAMVPLTTERGAADALAAAGLVEVRVDRVTLPWRFCTATELADEAYGMFGHNLLWNELTEDERERLRDRLRRDGVAEIDSTALIAVACVPA